MRSKLTKTFSQRLLESLLKETYTFPLSEEETLSMGFRIFPSRLGFSHKFKSLIASFQEERKKAKIIKERLENMYKFVIHLLRVKMKDEKREELIALRIETETF